MKKKIVSAVICAALAISVGAIGASANNHTDFPTRFNFDGSGASMYSVTAIQKTDTTYSYMKRVNSPKTYSAHVYGVNIGGTPVDVSQGHEYYFTYNNQYWYMLNWTKEWGYDYAGMTATPRESGAYSADTLWSPDSI